MSRYTAIEIEHIANEILKTYPADQLQGLYLGFLWGKTPNPQAWLDRAEMATKHRSALATGRVNGVLASVNTVQKWGFGKSVAADLLANHMFLANLLDALNLFNRAGTIPGTAHEEALSKLLNHKGVNIASVSKWICMIDQDRYAIFDSRVSIALRHITLPTGERAFPIGPRRAPANKVSWPYDAQILNNPDRMSRAYLDYLRAIQLVSAKINQGAPEQHLSPAQVEMALFMAGDVWRNNPSKLVALRQSMWA